MPFIVYYALLLFTVNNEGTYKYDQFLRVVDIMTYVVSFSEFWVLNLKNMKSNHSPIP